jgi:hypothetical protein
MSREKPREGGSMRLALLFAAGLLLLQVAQLQAADESTPSRPPAAENGSGSASPPANLSDQLSRSGGVIRPPDTDPGMAKSAPEPGPRSTPIIPPPGSPGGDPTIKPK